MEIAISDKAGFVDELLEHYLARGFGSLSKSDTDTLLMHLLLKYGGLENKPNHELSLALQLTETRLKNLRYQARLKYEADHDSFVRDSFFRLLQKAQLVAEKSDNSILFVVEDAFVKQGIKAKLKEIGHFADHSFNAELVKIREGAFVDLLDAYFDKDQKEQLERDVHAAIDATKKLKFRDLLHEFLKGAAKRAGSKAVDLTALGLTGGLSEASTWIAGIRDMLKGGD